jgi:hypothetical protein
MKNKTYYSGPPLGLTLAGSVDRRSQIHCFGLGSASAKLIQNFIFVFGLTICFLPAYAQKQDCTANITGPIIVTAAINASILLPVAQALTTPQDIIVDGEIFIDQDYTFASGSTLTFINQGSKLRVMPGIKLTILGSTLAGCNNLWYGIEVSDNANIELRDNIIRDAIAGIRLRNQTRFIVTGNFFLANVCGILATSTFPNQYISVSPATRDGISGNIFTGNSPLAEPFNLSAVDVGQSPGYSGITNWPNVGIWADRVVLMPIGKQIQSNFTPPPPLNEFKNFGLINNTEVTNGVRSINSHTIVRNSIFENIGSIPTATNNGEEGAAVYGKSVGNTATKVTVIGMGSADNSQLTFKRCYRDVDSYDASIDVSATRSEDAYLSIFFQGIEQNSAPVSIIVNNNFIDQFHQKAVDVKLSRPVLLSVTGNRIFNSDDPFEFSGFHYGVSIGNLTSAPISLKGVFSNTFTGTQGIVGNTIKSRSVLVDGVFKGIAFSKVTSLYIAGNTINDDNSNTSLIAYYGIDAELAPCDHTTIFDNRISGVKTNYDVSEGIYVRSSKTCQLLCNSVNKTNNGMKFEGICSASNLLRNSINTHDIGLLLESNNVEIGPQDKKENRWEGICTVAASVPNATAAAASRFFVNSSNMSSVYWPNPRQVAGIPDAGIWFTQVTGEPSENYSCTSRRSAEKPEERDFQVMEGKYEPYGNYPALVWEANWDLSGKLYENPELLTESSEMAAYFENSMDQSFRRMNKIYTDLVNRWEAPSTEHDNYISSLSTYNELLATRSSLNDQLTEDDIQNQSLAEQILEVDAALLSASDNLKSVSETLATAINESVSVWQNELSTISCNEQYEQDMQTVLMIMLATHNGEELSAEQLAILSDIAVKCRYSGGYAVLLARSCFAYNAEYPADLDCEIAERSSSLVNKSEATLMVSPNPVSDVLTITINGKIADPYTISVFNQQGQVEQTFIANSSSIDLPVTNLVGGIYFVRLTGADMNYTTRFVKSK